MRRLLLLSIFLVLSLHLPARAGDDRNNPRTVKEDVTTMYTTVGNIGLTVTNFGTIGTRNLYWPNQPSCEYPRSSGVEHLYQGGLWVGAVLKTRDSLDPRDGLILVTTGANDLSSSSRTSGEGYEFNSELSDSMSEYSTLEYGRPAQATFRPLAISHQDFVCDYSDRYTRVPETGDSILNHTPLNIRVHQESYAWNFPFFDFCVLLQYTIYNGGVDTLDSVYVGYWNNTSVRNTHYVKPGTPGYFNHTGQGYDPSNRTAYSFDFDGAPGGPPAGSYIGFSLLGATPFPVGVDSIGNLAAHTFYNAWFYRLTSGQNEYLSPTYDYFAANPYLSRYSRMTQSMPQQFIDALRTTPGDATYLLSSGPYHRLAPGDSVQVVFAVVCAKKFGNDAASHDTKVERQTLYSDISWAQRCYQGEDVNGNNILDPGEDLARRDSISPTEDGLRYVPDGKLTRYLLPAPPRTPITRAVVENQRVVIYWDKTTAEESIDPITGKKNFEGYRIYRSNEAADFLHHDEFTLNIPLVGEFDRADDSIGYNTGFSRIQLSSPKMFPGDTTHYWYQFPPKDVSMTELNGWQYYYGVSAFSQGDSTNGVPSLESALSYHLVMPGTQATSSSSAQIGVYPNPYYVNAVWDGADERQRKIYFYNLPARCEITIFTLAGDVVTVLNHDAATNNGQNIQWYTQFGGGSIPTQFSGGEHAWDLITRWDQAIATGLYLFAVKDLATGEVKRGKFLVIK
ncbi:MAG TPA: hypothetical protein VMW43_11730 [Bacteroidota bacterium]|nr:hypothetical protein [Bacteroidota bacterium]